MPISNHIDEPVRVRSKYLYLSTQANTTEQTMRNYESYDLHKDDTWLSVLFSKKQKRAVIHIREEGPTAIDDIAVLTKGWVADGWKVEIRRAL